MHEDTRGFKGCAKQETGPFSTLDGSFVRPAFALYAPPTVTRHPTGENPSKYYRVKSSRSLLPPPPPPTPSRLSRFPFSFLSPPPPSFRTVRRTTKENRIINAHLDWILIISPLRKTKLSGQLPVYLIARLKRRSREQEIYSRFISLIVGEVELRKLPRMAWHRSKSLKRDVNTRRFHPPSLHARVIYASAGRNRTGSMKLDYGHDIGFAANSNPDVINLSRGRETTIVGQRVYPIRKRTYVRGENDPRPATIDIELDCSPLTRHDRPSIPHYAGAIVMPGAVIADYTLVMPI